MLSILLAAQATLSTPEKIKTEANLGRARYEKVMDCVWNSSKKWVLERETAAAIVDAGLAKCSTEIGGMRSGLYNFYMAAPGETAIAASKRTDTVVDKALADLRGIMIAQVMDLRVKLEKDYPDTPHHGNKHPHSSPL